MAGAIGLNGIHTVTGVCDLCGAKCDPDNEDLNALDCTYKDCPPMVYHQDCLEKYLKSIRLEKNRKTGFKCPRGCGKGTRFKEGCRGKIDKSHPIHVRHDAKTEKKGGEPQKLQSQHQKQQRTQHTGENKAKNAKKKLNSKATLNVHDLNLMKLVPTKSERQDSEWCVKLKRSKSMDKSSGSANKKAARSKGQRLTGSFSFNASSRMGVKLSKSEVSSEFGSGDSAESVPSQGEGTTADADQSSSDTASLHQASGGSVRCESPENGGRLNNLPSLQEEALRNATAASEEMHKECKQCLVQWKTAMLVQQLYRMGFELWQARSAVQIFGSNMEEAIQWLVENGDIRESQLTAFLQQHPVAEICIEFELRSMAHACQHYQLEEALLEKTVTQYGGDLTSAINSLIGGKANEHVFPDCDLSLGIVHSETPLLSDDLVAHRSSSCLEPRRSVDTLSDELRLECVLGSALDDYKRGQADFTDLASKDLGYHYDNNRYASSCSTMNSPLSHHSTATNGSPSAFLQDQAYSFWPSTSQQQQQHAMQLGIEEAASSTTLRHFIVYSGFNDRSLSMGKRL